MPSSHLTLCHPLLLLPPIPSSIRVFSNESALRMRRWPKYWSCSFSIITSKEHPGLISFRMDWSLDRAHMVLLQGLVSPISRHAPLTLGASPYHHLLGLQKSCSILSRGFLPRLEIDVYSGEQSCGTEPITCGVCATPFNQS